MDYVLTLIGATLDEALASEIRAALAGNAGDIHWLGDCACDINLARPADKAAIMSSLRGRPIDFALQPVKDRRKKLLAADMDSTIIKQETIDMLAAHAGCENKIAAITERAMRGEIEFAEALRQRVALLKGLPESVFAKILNEIRLTSGAQTLTATMRLQGAQDIYCLLLSGGFEHLVRPIAERTGFVSGEANRFEIRDGVLTGNLIPPIHGAAAKKDQMLQQAERLNITADQIIAVGDGANDQDMLQAAGLGVAFHAKPILDKSADMHIRHNDLTALLYAQGIKQDEFASA